MIICLIAGGTPQISTGILVTCVAIGLATVYIRRTDFGMATHMMHYWRALIAVLAFLSIDVGLALAETNYTKTIELPPLRVSFSDLQTVVDKGATLMSAANGPSPQTREEVILEKGELRITLSGHQLDVSGAKLPDEIDAFEYTAYTLDAAPVSRLALSFADYRRTISISGQSPEHVDALFSTLREDLTRLSSSFGGTTFKAMLGFPAYWIVGSVLFLSGFFWLSTRSRQVVPLVLFSTILLLALVLLPTDTLFAGFSAIRGEPTFIVRYGPQISFWGTIIGTIIGVLSLLPSWTAKK